MLDVVQGATRRRLFPDPQPRGEVGDSSEMDKTCSTRALKNAKFIRAMPTSIIPTEEPIEGFHSIVPFDVLDRFGRMSEADLASFPELLDARRQLPSRPAGQSHPALFGAPPFKGTLHFVQLTFFFTGGGSTTINREDVATAIEYATLAVRPISAYCQQYGSNSLKVSPEIIQFGIAATNPRYNDDGVQRIVNLIMAQNPQLDAGSTCIIIINPPGLTNTDADPAQGVLGYHDKADVPYCFINVSGAGPLTVADRAMRYVDALSHEIAEMTCDPDASIFNDEVCDACAGNCDNPWQNYFTDAAPALANAYLRSARAVPPSLTYTYFTASVAQRQHADDCPAPQNACAYPPPMPVGRSTLLFYDRGAGTGEFYAVDGPAEIDAQYTHTDWRKDWTHIIPGNFTGGPYTDLLFYAADTGTGDFWQTDGAGGMARIASHTDWNTNWTHIIPGNFTGGPYTDLLFYAADTGTGGFTRSDGAGAIAAIKTYNNWRQSWAAILEI
jgi:hypothetical protein